MNILFNACTLFGRKISRPVMPEENNSIRTNEDFNDGPGWCGVEKRKLCARLSGRLLTSVIPR